MSEHQVTEIARRGSASIEAAGGEKRLVVDGAVQSVSVPSGTDPHGYWPALIPTRRPRQALILGLGGGTVVQLLQRTYGAFPIVGVDNHEDAIVLACEQFGLESNSLSIVLDDAEVYVRRCQDRFDLVVVDLFRGETIAAAVTRGSFRRRVRSLVAPGGVLIWNLHRDRRSETLRERVRSGLLLERRVITGLNLVLHCRRRARQQIR